MSECEKECAFNSNNECWLVCKNKFYNQALEDLKKALPKNYCNYCNQIACDGGRIGSIQECASVRMLVDVLGDTITELTK